MDPRRELAIPILFTLLISCTRPISDPVKLRAIKAEAQSLMAVHPVKAPAASSEIPKSQWPPAIASLQPQFVTVHQWGVDILIKPDFDGGWGYDIPRNKLDLPMPEKCYSEQSQGVFWHGPC
jgi:hypothetical protein